MEKLKQIGLVYGEKIFVEMTGQSDEENEARLKMIEKHFSEMSQAWIDRQVDNAVEEDTVYINMTPSKELIVATEELRHLVSKLNLDSEKNREIQHAISVLYTMIWGTLTKLNN